MPKRHYAVVFGHNRVSDLVETINGIYGQVDQLWVHDNASEPPLHIDLKRDLQDVIFVRDSEQPPNLARFWNNMLDQVDLAHRLINGPIGMEPENIPPYKVAILTDDLIIPKGWFDTVAEAMDRTGAAAGCTSGFENRLTQEILKISPDTDVANRMYGPAFIVRGEAELRVDERLRWWWNDTDMDWRARGAGGVVIAPGPYVHNKYPNASTAGVLAEQAGRDRETFKEIWGWNPW